MTFMDVHLTGLNEARDIVAEVHAFWWDGAALKEMLAKGLQATDPWPSWRGEFSSAQLRPYAEAHPNVAQAHRAELNAAIGDLLRKSTRIEALIQEA